MHELVQLMRSCRVQSGEDVLKDMGMAEHAGRADLGIHGSEVGAPGIHARAMERSIFAVTPKSNVF